MKKLSLLWLSAFAVGCASNTPAPVEPMATQTTSSQMGSTPSSATMNHDDSSMNGAPMQASGTSAKPYVAPTTPAPATETPAATTASTTPAPAMNPATPSPAARPDADNTRVNARDKSSAALTPMDQGGSEGDRKITQRIRQAVVGDSTLSFTAKNVKIITIGGKVTLRGPVKNDQERANIEARAKQVAGDTQVDNQLEVKK